MDESKQEQSNVLNLNYNNLVPEIKNMLKTTSSNNIKAILVKQGYDETKVESAIHEAYGKSKSIRRTNANIVLFKDFFDKIGYGFASPMLMFLLLYTLNVPLFLFGIIVGIKNFLTLSISSIVKEYHDTFNVRKKFIAIFGTLFGLSFLLMAVAKRIESPLIFSIGILLSTIFVVIHGDLYSNYVIKKLSRARSSITSKIIAYFGLIITAASFLFAGYLLDFSAIKINLGLVAFTIPGYLLELEIIAFAFIFSSYAFSFVKPEIRILKEQIQGIKKENFLKNYINKLKENIPKFIANKDIKMIYYGALFSGTFQTIITTFAGIYIYSQIKDTVLNPFYYVTIIFAVGIVAASIGPQLARTLTKIFGETPMLVFGVFLLAIFPLAIYFNVSYYAIIIANAVSILGASIISVVQSFVIGNSLSEEERKTYFSVITPLISIIMPILIILLTGIIYIIGFRELFLIIALLELIFVVPFYFSLMIKAHKIHKSRTFA
jgi:hypothetical protein